MPAQEHNNFYRAFYGLDDTQIIDCGLTERERAKTLILINCGITRMTLDRWLKAPAKILKPDRFTISLIMNKNLEDLFNDNNKSI